MISRYFIPALAVIGLLGGVMFAFIRGNPPVSEGGQVALPPSTPYQHTVAGTGIVEANTRNIEVGSHLSGIVSKVWVNEGDALEAGAPLFQIDPREAQAQLARAEAAVKTAQVAEADARDERRRAEAQKPGRSITESNLERRRFAHQKAQAELERAKAELKAAQTHLDLHTVQAPAEARVLKVHIREGEFVAAGSTIAPVVMGNDRPLHLRVSIDENDAWRYRPESKAVAALRSNKDMQFPLTFVRVEPYVQPKRDLSGAFTEKVDTRVLEVVYSFDPGAQSVYIGQQMDVFIESAGDKNP